jgi:hypothetical protein
VRAAPAVSVALLALMMAPGTEARPGRVVRVERPRALARTAPRLCQLAPRELRGQCFGRPPAVGEPAAVIDDSGVVAQLRVATVRETRDPCGNVGLWDVSYELVRGDPASRPSYLMLAVFDLPLGPRAHLLTTPSDVAVPGGPAWAQTWSALDLDGDSDADFALVGYTCDRDGTPQPTARDAFCAEYWLSDAGTWTRLRVDVTAVCF